MVNVTPAARQRLSEKLVDRSQPIALRIVLRGGRGKLCRSTFRSGDEQFVHEGRTVLLLAKDVVEHFDNRTLDVRKTDKGPKLRFRRAK